MLSYGELVFTAPNFVVLVVHNTSCVKGGFIAEKNAIGVGVPDTCINLVQDNCHRLDPFRSIMRLDVV
jgi:hypothetical protein